MLQVGVATGRLVTRGLEQGRKYTVNAEVTNQLGSSHQSTNGSWINNGVCTMIMVAMYQAVGIYGVCTMIMVAMYQAVGILYAPSFPAVGLTLIPSCGILTPIPSCGIIPFFLALGTWLLQETSANRIHALDYSL